MEAYKNFFILSLIILSSLVHANQEDSIQFYCKESYQNKINKLIPFTMFKINSFETAKGALYEAKPISLNKMKKLIREQLL